MSYDFTEEPSNEASSKEEAPGRPLIEATSVTETRTTPESPIKPFAEMSLTQVVTQIAQAKYEVGCRAQTPAKAGLYLRASIDFHVLQCKAPPCDLKLDYLLLKLSISC